MFEFLKSIKKAIEKGIYHNPELQNVLKWHLHLKLDFILPSHSIDPAISKEREMIKNDLLKTGYVESILASLFLSIYFLIFYFCRRI